MEQEAPYANDQVTDKSNQEHGVVIVAEAVRDASVCQEYESNVSQ